MTFAAPMKVKVRLVTWDVDKDRITSYNVCYTKLLRLRADQLVSLWALLERVAEALRHPGGLAVSSLLVLGVCWLLALLDALLVPARSGGAE